MPDTVLQYNEVVKPWILDQKRTYKYIYTRVSYDKSPQSDRNARSLLIICRTISFFRAWINPCDKK